MTSRTVVTVEPRGGSKDDSAQIQAALDYLETFSNAPALFLKAGVYTIENQLDLPDTPGLRIFGEGKSNTRLDYTGAPDATGSIFRFSETKSCNRYSISDLQLDTNNLLGSGIGGHANHAWFGRVYILGGLEGAFHVLGWDNTLDDCELAYATNGILVDDAGQNNDFTIRSCKFGNNDIGIYLRRSTNGVKIAGCAFQNNGHTAIYANAAHGLSLDTNYYEANADTGVTLTGGYGAETGVIQADVILNGDTAKAFSQASPCRGFSARGEFHGDVDSSWAEYAYYLNAVQGGEITACRTVGDSTGNLVGTYWHSSFSVLQQVSVHDNYADDLGAEIGFFPAQQFVVSTYKAMESVTFERNAESAFKKWTQNFCDDQANLDDLLEWPVISDTGTGAIAVSAEKFGPNADLVFEITVADNSDLFGRTVESAALAGKIVRYEAWVKNPAAEGFRLYTNVTGTHVDSIGDTSGEWVLRSMTFEMPDPQATIQLGFQKLGTAGNTCHITRPRLVEFGAAQNPDRR